MTLNERLIVQNLKLVTLILAAAIIAELMLAAMVIFLVWITTSPARAELCLPAIDNSIEKRSGYRWQWRMVEGDPRKCWFYSNTLLPKEDLVWSYTTREFDADVMVLERKYYFPETMELQRREIAPQIDDGR